MKKKSPFLKTSPEEPCKGERRNDGRWDGGGGGGKKAASSVASRSKNSQKGKKARKGWKKNEGRGGMKRSASTINRRRTRNHHKRRRSSRRGHQSHGTPIHHVGGGPKAENTAKKLPGGKRGEGNAWGGANMYQDPLLTRGHALGVPSIHRKKTTM